MTFVSLFVVGCLFLLICGLTSGYIGGDYPNDYPYYPPEPDVTDQLQPKPEVMRHRNGTDISLKCITKTCRGNNKNKIYWEFRACKPDKSVPCEKQPSIPHKIHDKDYTSGRRSKQCNYHYKINNAQERQSGIYHCIENNHIIKSYEVQILGPKKYGGPPEVLNVSTQLVPHSGQVIIKCEVHSEGPPLIFWCKESDDINKDTLESANFNNISISKNLLKKCYKNIDNPVAAHPVSTKTDVYLSKLNLQNMTILDKGIYVCVAISYTGISFKTVAVEVEEISEDTSFSFLFLIPLSLILVPIIFWLCYYRKRLKIKRNPPIQQQSPLIMPILVNNIKNQI